MENIQTKRILQIGGVIVILFGAIGLWWYVSQNEQISATAQSEEEQMATSTDAMATTTEEVEGAAGTTAGQAQGGAQQDGTEVPIYEGKGEPESTAQQTSPLQVQLETPTTQTPVVLGERQPAGSAAAALTYFAEAMAAQNFERATSYITPHLQDQYKMSFETNYPNGQHPLVTSYYAGTVDEVELVDPKYGIYEIAVYPPGGQLPFRPRFAFNAEVQEFVILEL